MPFFGSRMRFVAASAASCGGILPVVSAPGKSELLSAAFERLRAGDADAACVCLTEALIADPGDERIRLELAEVLVALGRNTEAVSLLASVARRCIDAGIHDEARNLFDRVLALDRSRVDVRMELALLYRRTGHPAEARAYYRDAARMYDERGRIAESLDAWCKVLELDPDDVAARVEQAETMARAGLAPQALASLEQIAERLEERGRVVELAQVLEGLVLLDPSHVGRLRMLAQLRLDERDRPERALAALQSAFRFDPSDLFTLELLAFAFLALGENEKALSVRGEILAFYERGVRDPAQIPIPEEASAGKLWEVDVFLRYGLPRRALAIARAFARTAPFRTEVRFKLHEAYLACGSVEGALNELLAALDLARLLERPEDVRRALTLADGIAPGHPAIRARRQLLGKPGESGEAT